jgi:uncharacterized protein with NAD-binding domain and iron-sulfur cluster
MNASEPSSTKGPGEKGKVAIVGGGAAAMAAAWELAKQGGYDITVYQMGWRLGGKGASGKNEKEHGRIEEHGLHVWMGFYENAFRMIRECYESLGMDWQAGFFPEPSVGVVETDSGGAWRPWISHLPPTPGLPGDPLVGDENPFTLENYLKRSITLFRALLRSVLEPPLPKRKRREAARETTLEQDEISFLKISPRMVVDKIARTIRMGALTTAAGLLEAVTLLEVLVADRFSLPGDDYQVLQYVEAIADSARRQLQDVVAVDAAVRAKLDLAELVLATVVGIVRDGLLRHPDGLDAINGEDCRDWLSRHGASDHACDSGFVSALYDMAFADVKVDDKDEPGIAAGQAIRGAFRMFFTYRGALFWKMRGGMGDVVFAPLYEALKSKGVTFKFFHRLKEVGVENGADGKPGYVTRLVFDVQAEVKDGPSSYRPLVERCWPSAALKDQLVDEPERDFEAPYCPAVREDTLYVNEHFNFVVLGISVEAIKKTCEGIIATNPRWGRMAKHVKTAATQAFQVWLKEGMEELGWPHGPITLAGIDATFDTWADMTHVVPEEGWKESEQWPKAVAYFCSALPAKQQDLTLSDTPQGASAADASVDHRALHFFRQELPQLWASDKARVADLTTRYAKANINPSDRYVLSRPGSLIYRISPLDLDYDNMTVAGDWTDCGFNEGCVEAAVMSGRLAANALSGTPKLEEIVGFDHP